MATETSDTIKLRFRYWNARGRAQSVRYMLADIANTHKNVDYEECIQQLENAQESWFPNKFNEQISGPFHNLPVLHLNDANTFGQTLTIGQFLARKFGLYGQLTSSIKDKDILHAYIDGVVSCAYTDIISNVLTLIWMQTNFNDEKEPMFRLIGKIATDLKSLNDLLKKSSTPFFYDQPEPTIADYFVFEAFTISRDLHKKLVPNPDDYSALIKLEKTMKERPGLANYFNQGLLYKRFTGSPKEAEYLATFNEAK